ncbi:GTP-binding protein-like protein 2 [Sarcoptes scabiei]|uniref:GTP-binding protein-like protein 2 n=1 Tax=Sarcoptes scabiei TaxID=52283 RepID=A0A132AKP4_SARSC|nr:GTP-binding protein-like protein 2 [Sarcoptes scabiei]
MSSLYHRVTHKVLVLGPSGSGKSCLIESLLDRTKRPYKQNHSNSAPTIKQCIYSQSVPFREIQIEMKVFERTIDGPICRSLMQPFYSQLDTIIGVYDQTDHFHSFQKLQLALDSLLALYKGTKSPTIYVLGNVRDRRACTRECPFEEVRDYIERIGAQQMYNYCFASRHIKAFHHVIMLNAYRKHFCHQQFLSENYANAIENCRKHIYCVEKRNKTNRSTMNLSRKSSISISTSLKLKRIVKLRSLFRRLNPTTRRSKTSSVTVTATKCHLRQVLVTMA